MSTPRAQSNGREASAGFTLIEVMAVVMLTAIVITFAVNFFFNLTENTDRAVARTRGMRHSVALLDRIARDLESAYLLTKPEETDPLDHPWLFVADGPISSEGADRVRFISRNHRRRTTEGHASDFATVTLMLREADPGYELVRLEEPGMPYQQKREFPSDDAEGMMVMGEGIKSFSMRFMGEEGDWQDAWDSTQLLESSALPLAVELQVILLADGEELPDEEDFESFGDLGDEGEPKGAFKRHVLLPFRPIDLAALEAGGQSDGEGECISVSECINSVARQPCNAFWRAACDTVLESNAPETCIEDAENMTDGLLRWCETGGGGDPDLGDEGDGPELDNPDDPFQEPLE